MYSFNTHSVYIHRMYSLRKRYTHIPLICSLVRLVFHIGDGDIAANKTNSLGILPVIYKPPLFTLPLLLLFLVDIVLVLDLFYIFCKNCMYSY